MMHRPARHYPIMLNLAPMVDVMMCLLIFFMVATRMVEVEHSRLDLPLARTAQLSEPVRRDEPRLVINIESTSQGPRFVVREQPVTADDLDAMLRRQAARDPGAACLIRADRGVAYRAVDLVLKRCMQAGITQVAFGAIQSDEVPP